MATPALEPIVVISSSPPQPDYGVISPVRLCKRAKSPVSPVRKSPKPLKAGLRGAAIPEGACPGFQSAGSLAGVGSFDAFRNSPRSGSHSAVEAREAETQNSTKKQEKADMKPRRRADPSKLKLDRKPPRHGCQGLKEPTKESREASIAEGKSDRFDFSGFQEGKESSRVSYSARNVDSAPDVVGQGTPQNADHAKKASLIGYESKTQSNIRGRITKPNMPAAGVLKPVFRHPMTSLRDTSKHFSTSACENDVSLDYDGAPQNEILKGSKESTEETLQVKNVSKADNAVTEPCDDKSQSLCGAAVSERRPSATRMPELTQTAHEVTEAPENDAAASPSKAEENPYRSLMEKFSYTGHDIDLTISPACPQSVEGPSRKRQKLRDDGASRPPRNSSPAKKQKSAAKGVRTITGLVTAPYQAKNNTDDGVIVADTERRFFLLGAAEMAPTKKRATKPKRPQKRAQKLLEPDRAIKKMETQDIFFATSSQLTSNEPISYLRDLQRAKKESEACGDGADPNRDSRAEHTAENSQPRKLWEAGARGDEGSLFEMEPPTSDPISPAESEFVDVDSIPIATAVTTTTSTATIASPTKLKPALRCLDHMRKSTAGNSRYALAQVSGNHNINVSSSPTKIQMITQTAALHTVAPSKQKSSEKDAESSTLADGTKAKRPRGRPRKDQSEKEPTKSKTSTEKGTKGQQQKSAKQKADDVTKGSTKSAAANDGFQHIDEIEDSEPEPASSPSRKQKKKPKQEDTEKPDNASNQLELAPRSKKKTFIDPVLLRKKQQALFFSHLSRSLFPAITRAVKSSTTPVSSTKDTGTDKAQRQPSWHEKMLLYDPIVLEDITDWLNDGVLEHAGFSYDHEFNAASDAAENATEGFAPRHHSNEEEGDGKKRKKPMSRRKRVHEEVNNGNGEMKVMPWMVQRWCEEHSICCLWRDGMRGGVKSNY
ncbi:MAG: 5'-flap endonuclease [Alyxoria varia]|nr:MAG: 5'-flap endonuclease [Alyxoria varia]